MLKIFVPRRETSPDLATVLRGRKFLDVLMERDRTIADQKREITRLKRQLAAHERQRDAEGCFW